MASTLKVNTIQHTGGTTGMTIDSAGRILTPTRPAFKASINTTTGRDTHTSVQTTPYDTVQVNIGNHYNNSTYTFTAPITGTYYFSTSQNKYGKLILYFYKNGGVYHAGEFLQDSGAAWEHCTIATIIDLNANDTIQPKHKLVNNSSTQYAWNGGSTTWDSFSGFLIG